MNMREREKKREKTHSARLTKKQQSSVKKTKNGKGDERQQQQQWKTKNETAATELHADMSSCFRLEIWIWPFGCVRELGLVLICLYWCICVPFITLPYRRHSIHWVFPQCSADHSALWLSECASYTKHTIRIDVIDKKCYTHMDLI